MTETRRFASRLLVPVDGAPIREGILEVTAGRISAVFPGPDSSATDLGDCALIPGLINAHTHLEFSDLEAPLPASDGLAPWIRDLVASRRERRNDSDPLRRGLEELRHCGTAGVGEIATDDWPSTRIGPTDPFCVVFREILGLRRALRPERLALARDFLADASPGRCLRGLSPHAPFSVHPDLFTDLVELANAHDVPLAIHLAESREERELLARGTGPLRHLLEELDAWEDGAIPRGTRPLDYLQQLAVLQRPLVVHGNLLDDAEIEWLGRHPHVVVVYCPRTHVHFGHPPHPWQRLRDGGTPVVLGTDGRASNPDLSIWHELQFLSRTSRLLSAHDLLTMATQTAARALGLDNDLGTLTPGKEAFAVAVTLPSSSGTVDAIIQSGRLAGTLQNGHWRPA